MKQFVEPIEYAGIICKALSKGALLTTKDGKEVNTMTIGWGMIGIEWGKPVFLALVRQSRHTKQLLDATGEFTVSIPLDEADRNILKVCGTRSGRDTDKIALLGLTPEAPEKVSAPGFRELPLTLECKVVYQQQQNPDSVLDSHIYTHYQHPCPDIEQDYHTVYYGEILSAYIIE